VPCWPRHQLTLPSAVMTAGVSGMALYRHHLPFGALPALFEGSPSTCLVSAIAAVTWLEIRRTTGESENLAPHASIVAQSTSCCGVIRSDRWPALSHSI
jgi:hypothetical protein